VNVPHSSGRSLLAGGAGGVIGGVVFGLAMLHLGQLPNVGEIFRVEAPPLDAFLHLLVSAILGSLFGALVGDGRLQPGDVFIWGLVYGTFWWFLGPLTLLPAFLGEGLTWSLGSAQASFSSFLGYLVYGAVTALVLTVAHPDLRPRRFPGAAAVRGALAGAISMILLRAWLQGHGLSLVTVDPATLTGLETALVGAGVGGGFGALYPRPRGAGGSTLVQGMAYGFFWWIVGSLTLQPALETGRLGWSLEMARSTFPVLPGHLLTGAALALLYQGLDAAARLLFSDRIPERQWEGPGIQGLRTTGRGLLAGSVGGLLFTLVMVQVGMLPRVASLVGSRSALVGLLVHLAVANVIGGSYGLLFRRHSYDVGSGLGWGISYGLFWWFCGALTLMPAFLGGSPRWSAGVAGQQLPSLVGHLLYGAGLGVTFHALEARYSPWWIVHREYQAQPVHRRKEQVLTSAPALWMLALVIALVLPILLAP